MSPVAAAVLCARALLWRLFSALFQLPPRILRLPRAAKTAGEIKTRARKDGKKEKKRAKALESSDGEDARRRHGGVVVVVVVVSVFIVVATMPFHGSIVVIRRSGADGSIFPLVNETCYLGRAEGCDIRVQLPTVAKEHCRVSVSNNQQVRIRRTGSWLGSLREEEILGNK